MSLVPLSWKIAAGAALVLALLVGHTVQLRHADAAGYARAVKDRAAADALAVAARLKENAATSVKQAATNTAITKAKNDEIAPVRERIVTKRVYVGSAICGPTAPAQAESPASSDGADSPGRLVRADVERDIRALKLAVEEDLATGRACQAFLRENDLTP